MIYELEGKRHQKHLLQVFLDLNMQKSILRDNNAHKCSVQK